MKWLAGNYISRGRAIVVLIYISKPYNTSCRIMYLALLTRHRNCSIILRLEDIQKKSDKNKKSSKRLKLPKKIGEFKINNFTVKKINK